MKMTREEKQAYDWALNQNHSSVAATYARILAKFIFRSAIYDPVCCRCGQALTTDEATCAECKVNKGLTK